MGYITPCDAAITDTWQGHKNRNPPSQEPGTDYGAARGTPVRCAEAGTVVDLQSSPSGATGRYVTVNLDDGRRVRYLHLSQVTVGIGARVSRGQTIARSGASGFGSETGYGAHVHVSLWSSPGQSISNTIDFQLYVGNPTTPPQEEDDMFTDADRNALTNIYNAIFNGGPSMNDAGRSIAFSLANLTEFADRIDKAVGPVNRTVNGSVQQIALKQEVADAKTNTIELLRRVPKP